MFKRSETAVPDFLQCLKKQGEEFSGNTQTFMHQYNYSVIHQYN